jgi:hypothetical protein
LTVNIISTMASAGRSSSVSSCWRVLWADQDAIQGRSGASPLCSSLPANLLATFS